MKTVLTIAGSDSGGGAGIQADLKSFAANEVYGASVITAITAQNTTGVYDVYPIPSSVVKSQLEAVFSDLDIQAVKIGMVSDIDIMNVISDVLIKYKPKYVVLDPVMVSTTGHTLLQQDQIDSLKSKLFSLATIITPNISEAEVLLDRKIKTFDDMKLASYELHKKYNCYVLLKGGHFPIRDGENVKSIDVLSNGEMFEMDWINTTSTHGTGCSLSSAIASNLAKGHSISKSIENAKKYVNNGIANSYKVGQGNNPIHHFYKYWGVDSNE
jgi:hydroxymethylpyrimidine/phosphomethylpyrimidine kinase